MFEIVISEGHFGHETRKIVISKARGISAEYCLACDQITKYLFEDSWDKDEAKAWVGENAPAYRAQETDSEMAAFWERLNFVVDAVTKIKNSLGLQRPGPDMALALSLQEMVQAGQVAVFELQAAGRKEGVIVNDQGWIRKPILRTGSWAETPPGASKPLQIALAHLQMIKSAFDAGVFERVCVPIGHGGQFDDIDYVTAHNTGYVMALEISKRDDGEYSLDAWFDFTDPETEKNIRLGNIWNCSVLLVPNTRRPSDGQEFPLALKHVALTNYPWIEDLPGFVEASRSAVRMKLSNTSADDNPAEEVEDEEDGEMEVTQEQLNILEALQAANLTPEGIAALARERDEIETQRAQLDQDRLSLAQVAHKGRVEQIVMALEGKHAVDGIETVEGHRHYPAVVKAVEEALLSLPPEAGIRLSREDGSEGDEVKVVDLILGVANAIPQEGRVALSNPDLPESAEDRTESTDGRTEDGEVDPDAIEDEDLEDLGAKLSL